MKHAAEPKTCPVCGSEKLTASEPPALLQDSKLAIRQYRCDKGHCFTGENTSSDNDPTTGN